VTADIDDGFEFKEHNMAVTHRVRYIAPAVLVTYAMEKWSQASLQRPSVCTAPWVPASA